MTARRPASGRPASGMTWCCPLDRVELRDVDGRLVPAGGGREYEVSKGIPIFAADEEAATNARREIRELAELWRRMAEASSDEAGRWFCERHGCSRELFAGDWKYLFAPPESGRILELGAGFGDDSVILAQDRERLVLAVPTLTNARILERRLSEHDPGPWSIAVLPSVTRLPLADGSVGAIALEEAAVSGFGITDRSFPQVAAEWRRVLTDDGTVFVGMGNALHRLPGAGFVRSRIQRSSKTSLNRAIKLAQAAGKAGSLSKGTVLREMRRQGFPAPTVYAPLPGENKIDVVIPVEDRHVVRYFLDNLVRKNSPVVRAAIALAHRALNLGLFPRLVPYHYLIFKGRETGRGEQSIA